MFESPYINLVNQSWDDLEFLTENLKFFRDRVAKYAFSNRDLSIKMSEIVSSLEKIYANNKKHYSYLKGVLADEYRAYISELPKNGANADRSKEEARYLYRELEIFK